MIEIRPINISADYPLLESWWKGHGALPIPFDMFCGAQGFFAVESGAPVAASFLYLVVGGKAAIFEWTTTCPTHPSGRDKLVGVKALYDHLETLARAAGCKAVFSFVKPASYEERALGKLGYFTTPDDPGHKVFCKNLGEET